MQIINNANMYLCFCNMQCERISDVFSKVFCSFCKSETHKSIWFFRSYLVNYLLWQIIARERAWKVSTKLKVCYFYLIFRANQLAPYCFLLKLELRILWWLPRCRRSCSDFIRIFFLSLERNISSEICSFNEAAGYELIKRNVPDFVK